MNRIVAILLMLFFVVGNSFAHAHGIAAHRSPSQTRAHIHLGIGVGHVHHSHKHGVPDAGGKIAHMHPHHGHDHEHEHQEKTASTLEEGPVQQHPVEHDSDAVYLVAVDYLYTTAELGSVEFDGQLLTEVATSGITVLIRPSCVYAPPNYGGSELPLYLLYAALRR